MRVVIVVNSASGRRRAGVIAREVGERLVEDGHAVRWAAIGGENGTLAADFAWAGFHGAAMIVGGDGTVHHAIPHAVEHGTALYHVPSGNENLFAREFGMGRTAGQVRAAIQCARSRDVDVLEWRTGTQGGGEGRGGLLAIMLSLGPDAGVIHRLDGAPRRGAGKAAYVGPVVREVWSPSIPRLRAIVDGREWLGGERGMLVAANMRQYALRIDPAHGASVDDGHADLAFVACRSSFGWMGAMARGFYRALVADSPLGPRDGIRGASGREIRIESLEGPTPVQVDGEGIGLAEWVEVRVRPRALRVLVSPS